VRDAASDTLIIANGFSCQQQISQATQRSAMHLADVLHLARQGNTFNGRRSGHRHADGRAS
jgi:hypothetical protein